MYDAFLQEIVQINFIPICIILYLIIFLRFNNSYEKELTKLFIPVLVMLVGLIIDDNLDYYAFTAGENGIWHVLTAFFGYNLRIFICVSLIMIALRNSARKTMKIALYVPAFTNLVITSLAFFTDWAFGYAENGKMIKGPLFYTPHSVLVVYSVILCVYSIHIWVRHDRKCEAVVISITVLLTLMGTLCELIFHFRGILIGVIAMAVTFYYLCIHIEYFKYDILTGVYNRISFYADLNKLKGKSNVGIMSLDLNNLKTINDMDGHIKGDQAIKNMAVIVNSVLDSRGTLYRVGGDEFAVIIKDSPESDIKVLVDRIKFRMRETPYVFAIGYSMCDGKEHFRDVYARADKAMYANKRELKESKGEKA